jgi:hypothetical protein
VPSIKVVETVDFMRFPLLFCIGKWYNNNR